MCTNETSEWVALLSRRQVGAILGRKGSEVQRIRRETGCRVYISDDKMPGLALQNDRLCTLQVCPS